MLDLKDDAGLIAEYEAMHRRVWPEVIHHLRGQGVIGMEIFRLGTRLCMLMETDDDVFDARRESKAATSDAVVREWEHLMWKYQLPTPWTVSGEKWTEAALIFDLSA